MKNIYERPREIRRKAVLDRFHSSIHGPNRARIEAGSHGIFKGFLDRLYSKNDEESKPKNAKFVSSTRISRKKPRSRKKDKRNFFGSPKRDLGGKEENKSTYEFEVDPNGSIFANHELLKHTVDKDVQKESKKPLYSKNKQEGIEFQSLENSMNNKKYKTFQNQLKSRMYQRKSFEKEFHKKKSILPMLLKFKQNGKTVDISQTPLRRLNTHKQQNKNAKVREKSLENLYRNRDLQHHSSGEKNFENSKISEVVRETMTYFLPPGQETTKKRSTLRSAKAIINQLSKKVEVDYNQRKERIRLTKEFKNHNKSFQHGYQPMSKDKLVNKSFEHSSYNPQFAKKMTGGANNYTSYTQEGRSKTTKLLNRDNVDLRQLANDDSASNFISFQNNFTTFGDQGNIRMQERINNSKILSSASGNIIPACEINKSRIRRGYREFTDILHEKPVAEQKREEESLPEPLGPEIPPSPPSEPQEVQEPAEVKKGKAVFKVKSTLNQVGPDPIIAECITQITESPIVKLKEFITKMRKKRTKCFMKRFKRLNERISVAQYPKNSEE
ncbi:unnamed protein product [Moneuplotes crassus]|uniref:Uncharacterized protein n=1 Tax=Euplotes crassus TaxID=5936 RepID=A0AAD1YAJ6_EUPCR|nr:unnamed protein product [Moneuplotes crassus]